MRQSDPPVRYLVGEEVGRGALAREKVQVKLCPQDPEIYVLVKSQDRLQKERAMRRSRLRRYWKRLGELRKMKDLHRDDLLKKLGAAQADAGRAQGLVEVQEPQSDQMMDVHFPTTNRRKLIFRRFTRPEIDQSMLLNQLKLQLPPQAPQITSAGTLLIPGSD